MKIQIVAESSSGGFVARDDKMRYFALSASDWENLKVRDVLENECWDNSQGQEIEVLNVTQRKNVIIELEDFECSQSVAYNRIPQLFSPKTILTIESVDKSFMPGFIPDHDYIGEHLRFRKSIDV